MRSDEKRGFDRLTRSDGADARDERARSDRMVEDNASADRDRSDRATDRGEPVRDRDDETSNNQNATEEPGALFEDADAEGYRTRWSGIQTGFVDEPRHAVEEADALV